MNWTGGRLQRHSTVADSAKNRQKQHFAKVHQNLRNGKKGKSPIRWSIFDVAEDDGYKIYRPSAGSRQHSEASRSARSQSLVPNKTSLIASLIQQNRGQGARRRSISPLRRHSRPIKRERPSNIFLNGTTSILQKRKWASSGTRSERLESVAEEDEEEKQDPILEKRRKILQKGDWVGVSIQKPLQLTFAKPEQEENIGRRRKISADQRARFSEAQTRIVSPPFASKYSRAFQSPRHGPNGTTSKTDVRISIGGRVVPPGISSSSVHRRNSHSTVARKRSPTISSDVMLLDNEEGQARTKSTSSNIENDFSDSSMQDKSEEKLREFVENPLARERRRQMQSRTEDSEHHIQRQNRNAREASFTEFNSSGDEDTKLKFREGKLHFSISQASVQQPKPQSSKVSSLLRSSSSEVAGSTVAQVGLIVPLVPSSQILDNEGWAAWMPDPESDEIDFREVDYSRESAERVPTPSISPGVSMAHFAKHQDRLGDEGYEEADSELDVPEFESMVQEMSLHGSLSRSSSPDTGDSSQYKRDSGISLEEPASGDVEPKTKATSRPQPVITFQTPLSKAEEDGDAAWRKFVFPSNSDEEEANTGTNFSTSRVQTKTRLETVLSSSSVGIASAAATYCPTTFKTPKHSSNISVHLSGIGSSDSASASMVGHGRSVHEREILRSFTTKSKVRFTKPIPFVGRKVSRDYVSEEIHLGRGLGIDVSGRKRKHDMKVDDDMGRDDAESIEDE